MKLLKITITLTILFAMTFLMVLAVFHEIDPNQNRIRTICIDGYQYIVAYNLFNKPIDIEQCFVESMNEFGVTKSIPTRCNESIEKFPNEDPAFIQTLSSMNRRKDDSETDSIWYELNLKCINRKFRFNEIQEGE